MIEVTKDPDELNEFGTEHCCFCRRPTRYWFTPKDVPVCRACAPHANEKDVPSKKTWWRREEIAIASRRPPKPKHRRTKGADGLARTTDQPK